MNNDDFKDDQSAVQEIMKDLASGAIVRIGEQLELVREGSDTWITSTVERDGQRTESSVCVKEDKDLALLLMGIRASVRGRPHDGASPSDEQVALDVVHAAQTQGLARANEQRLLRDFRVRLVSWFADEETVYEAITAILTTIAVDPGAYNAAVWDWFKHALLIAIIIFVKSSWRRFLRLK